MRARRHRSGGRTRAQFFAERRQQRAAQLQQAAAETTEFAEKTQLAAVMLTRLGKRLLDEARRRDGKTAGEVVERLLRQRLPHDLRGGDGGGDQ